MKNINTSSFLRTTALTAASLTVAIATSNTAHATTLKELPSGYSIEAGSATINSTNKLLSLTSSMTVNQTTDRLVVNWNSFNIGPNATVTFVQPTVTALAVNRVTGSSSSPTEILGTLKANGNIIVIDKNGIIFGANSVVDVHGIIATTGDISTADIKAGKNIFNITGMTNKEIDLKGTINVADAGLAAFVSPIVKNSGTITAKLGKVTLASGKAVTVDLYGDNLISIAIGSENKLTTSLLENSGTINAKGGTVTMTASAAKSVVDSVINMNGVINVDTVSQKNGKIVLSGGDNGTVTVGRTGVLSSFLNDSTTLSANGGTISLSGKEVVLGYNTNLTAKNTNIATDALDIYQDYKKLLITWAEGADIKTDNFAITRQSLGSINLGTGATTSTVLNLTDADFDAVTAKNITVGDQAKTSSITVGNIDLANNASLAVELAAIDSVSVKANSVANLGSAEVTVDTAVLNLASNVKTKGSILGDADTVNVLNNKVSIQQGIDFASVGGTVNVAAGTYNQSVEIDKSITLNGANAGVDGSSSSRGAETILTNDGSNWYNIAVTANNVTVDGFKIVGDKNVDSEDYGITTIGTSNTIIKNNDISNAMFGVFFWDNGAAATTGGLVQDNSIHDIDWQAIHIRGSQYADVISNDIKNTEVGITVEFMANASPDGKTYVVKDNNVSANLIGIRSNMVTGNGTGYLFEGNTITAEGTSLTKRWVGVDILSQPGDVASTFLNNTIDGSALNGSGRLAVGYEATNILSNKIAIDGGSITGVDYGVWATDGASYTGAVNDLTISNVDFNDIRKGDILVEDTTDVNNQTGVNSTGTHVTIGSGNSFTNSAYDLVLKGSNATADSVSNAGVMSTLVSAAGNATYTGNPYYTASPTTLTTDNASIQNGIDATSYNGTVTVDAGTFTGSIDINKPISLVGAAGNATTITATDDVAVTVDSSNVTLNGFTVSGGKTGVLLNNASDAIIVNNVIVNTIDSAISAVGTMFTAIMGNTIDNSNAGNGIELTNANLTAVINNNIDGLKNGVVVENVGTAILDSNTITSSTENGLYVKGSVNGQVILSGNTFTDNTVGARFESGYINFTSPVANSFTGGEVAMMFDNQGSSSSTLGLAGNTLGSQIISNTGTYIVLANGALFNEVTNSTTGAKYLLSVDATNVSFDGSVVADATTPYAISELAKVLEKKIVDNDDDSTLGDIYVGSILGDTKFEDRLVSLSGVNFQSFNNFSIQMRGMPYATTTQLLGSIRPAAGTSLSAANLNNIEPAAGGNASAEEYSNMEPAAGSSSCWNSGSSVNMEYSDNKDNMLRQASACAI